ncbi:5-formyltetrahydrofolate cyclo-ligase [Hymenobacter sp. HMF4947]|uniref:5-formyltetrahydrofolate cyclo-ligase n=1 Tax=Hymenobacter ginkgonis TaxID=2682976 RepID=A0A7K1TCR9_9BACT|nr:5-formyltetrahydrofolate cyclo-ligase [Hymenobacter ginkgonis]MVN76175.1 5-formyltetrahydrofolate cyclo-ligase [Hymenobacter ginkgonis]
MTHYTKAALRRAALPRRQALSRAEVTQRSQQLCDQLFRHFLVGQWRWLHVFLPLALKNEPDTWPLIHRVWAEALPLRLAAPVVQPDVISLRHYELTPTTPLRANRWGIPEPVADPTTEVAPAQLEAVLVPLLACDQQGQRVGYGGGFYDRFLAQCQPKAVFIGLNILDEAPVAAIADVLPTDVALHACLTPSRVWNFG